MTSSASTTTSCRGEDNSWDDRSRVEVWWEAGRDAGARAPGWVTALDHWSESERAGAGELVPWRLALRAGGALSEAAAGPDEGATPYLYVQAWTARSNERTR